MEKGFHLLFTKESSLCVQENKETGNIHQINSLSAVTLPLTHVNRNRRFKDYWCVSFWESPNADSVHSLTTPRILLVALNTQFFCPLRSGNVCARETKLSVP